MRTMRRDEITRNSIDWYVDSRDEHTAWRKNTYRSKNMFVWQIAVLILFRTGFSIFQKLNINVCAGSPSEPN